MFYLTTYSTHFIYSYMVLDIWYRTIQIVREETRCCHMDYSFRLAARILLYTPSHRQDTIYHSLCYSCGAQARMKNNLIAPPLGIDPTTHQAISICFITDTNKQHLIITNNDDAFVDQRYNEPWIFF